MKKIIYLLLFVALNSCNNGDNSLETVFKKDVNQSFSTKSFLDKVLNRVFMSTTAAGWPINNPGGIEIPPADSSTIEFLSFGASHGGGGGERNVYFDKTLMLNQGWYPIAVKGDNDKKIEMWFRQKKIDTYSTIMFPNKAKVFTYLRLKGLSIKSINYNTNLSHSKSHVKNIVEYEVPNSNDSGYKILGYFSDDSVELTDVGSKGKIVNQSWGFGDGDGLSLVLYENKSQLPRIVKGVNHNQGGKQYVGMLVTLVPYKK